jgi:hypothetical protein
MTATAATETQRGKDKKIRRREYEKQEPPCLLISPLLVSMSLWLRWQSLMRFDLNSAQGFAVM